MTKVVDLKLTANLSKARAFMERFVGGTVRHRIGGESVLSASGETFETLDPTTNRRQCTVAAGGTDEIDRAARAAQPPSGPGGTCPAPNDARSCTRLRMRSKRAPRRSRSSRAPIADSRSAIWRRPPCGGRRISASTPTRRRSRQRPLDARYRPSQLFDPPADRSRGHHHALEHAVHAVDLEDRSRPRGRLHDRPQAGRVVAPLGHHPRRHHGRGDPQPWRPGRRRQPRPWLGEGAGRALTEHPAIRAVAFVGETTTGSHIMRQGADTLKRVHFELGGKNPVVVFDDADLDRALDAVLFMIYSLNGERCTSSSRALVQRPIYEAFSRRVTERVGHLKVGHPLDPGTEIGPLIHPRHAHKVLSYPALAEAEGARIAAGGGRAMAGGGQLCRADALSRRDEHHAHRAGRDFRPRPDYDPLRGRGGGGRDRQRRALRPRRLSLDARYRPGAPRLARPRGGDDLGEFRECPPPADALRRHEEFPASAGTAATTPSISTWRRRTSRSPSTVTRCPSSERGAPDQRGASPESLTRHGNRSLLLVRWPPEATPDTHDRGGSLAGAAVGGETQIPAKIQTHHRRKRCPCPHPSSIRPSMSSG